MMLHVQPTTLTEAVETAVPVTPPPSPNVQAELDVAISDWELKKLALDPDLLGRLLTSDEAAILQTAKERADLAMRAIVLRKEPHALQSAIDALHAYEPEYRRLRAIHSAADQANIDAKGTEAKSETEVAERKAEANWMAAWDHREELGKAVLAVPARNVEEALRKQATWADVWEVKSGAGFAFREEANVALDAALADLRCLGVAAGRSVSPALAELISVHGAKQAETMRLDKLQFTAPEGEQAAISSAWESASTDEMAAYCAVRDYPAANLHDVIAQIAFFREEDGDLGGTPEGQAVVESIHRLCGVTEMVRSAPLQRVPWAKTVAEVARADAAWDAADENIPGEDERLGNAQSEMEAKLERLPAPSLAALVHKMAIRLRMEQRRDETVDDVVTRLLTDTDYLQWSQAVAFTDAVTLARIAGEDVPLYPRALNGRLAMAGVTVTPLGFTFPDDLRVEAQALLKTITDDQANVLMAAAWIDAYVGAGGTISMFNIGGGDFAPYFWSNLDQSRPTPELDRLLDMLPTREGALQESGGSLRLRLAVAKLAQEQLTARGVRAYGALAA